MKKRMLALLLLSVLSISGCQSAPQVSENNKQEEVKDDDTNKGEENSEGDETVNGGTGNAQVVTPTVSVTSTAEPSVEPTKEPETTVTPTPTATPKPTKEPTPTPTATPKPSYTYKELEKTMYAIGSVNVRDLPSTDGKKVGALDKDDKVTVTGKCNETGWYRIKLDGKTLYVSNKYLTTEKPVIPTPTPVVKPTTTPTLTATPTATPTPAIHVHKWEEVTKVVQHEEEGHWEEVVVEEAWTETTGGSWRTICNGCGIDMTDMEDDEFALHCAIFCQSSYGNRWITTTIEHPAVTEQQWIVDKEAYTETVVTGYKCDCGEVK